jgi:translation initiation factor 3 subunit L
MINWGSTEDCEINVNPEDLPNFKLTKEIEGNEDGSAPGQTANPKEIARNFIVELQKALNERRVDDLFYIYDRKFNKLSEQHFKNQHWPPVHEIEEADEDLEIDLNTNYLYTELCYRHAYARLQGSQITLDVRLKSYANYLQIFETVLIGKEDIPLPIQWIWDIEDEFLYQYQAFCNFRAKMRDTEDSNYQLLMTTNEDVWNLEKIKWVFTSLIEKSKIIKAGKNQLEEVGAQTKTFQYFGYFALVCLLRLHVQCCEYEAGLKAIEPIEFKKLNIFSKAFPCLITLFYYSGFCYLMSKRYKEAVKIFEAIISSYIKYKQFFSKSFQAEAMSKLNDKMLNLLAVALKFYNIPLEENVSSLLKERLAEKLDKLNKYDVAAFNDCFGYGCPKLIPPLLNKEHLKTYGFDRNLMETMNQQKDLLVQEFQKIQQLNNLDGVLKLYSSIKLDKLAKVMKLTPEKLKDLINLYIERSNANLKDNMFEQTIVRKFIESVPKIDLVNDKDVIKINETIGKANFSKIFVKNMNKLEEMMKEIQML